MNQLHRTCILTALLVLCALPLPSPAQETGDNPFGGFQTWILPNGLKVWYKRMPGQENVALSVTVGVGSDQDPAGKEQLAHFLEHMQFSDHLGLTTQQIKDQIEQRGGVFNGTTSADITAYFVRIKKEEALFAMEWLYNIVSPHEMKPEVVDRERYPVEVEVGARPREALDWIGAIYFNPPLLRQPGLWNREFGLDTGDFRDRYYFRSLRSITPDDLKAFYERYYSPNQMTLTVIGDVDRGQVFEMANETFALLMETQPSSPRAAIQDSGRRRQTYDWDSRSNVAYSRRIRFPELSADDDVMLLFIGRLLGKRLNDQLRFGERKAAYGISTGTAKRDGAAYFAVSGTIRDEEFEFARGVIEEEISALKNRSLSPETFERERAVLIQQLRVSNSTPESLELWARSEFANRSRYRDFPDLLFAFQNLSQAEISNFVQRYFTPKQEFNSTVYPMPVSQGILLIAVVLLVVATVRVMAFILTRPIDMTRIRYVARIRVPKLMYLTVGFPMLVVAAVSLRILFFIYQRVADAFVVTSDSVVFQWSIYALMGASLLAFIVLLLSLLPSKVLVFEDRVLIKYRAYRSVAIPFDQIASVSLKRFRDVWLNKGLRRNLPFKVGLFTPGIYLERRIRRSYFFDTRARTELLDLLKGRLEQGARTQSAGTPPLGTQGS